LFSYCWVEEFFAYYRCRFFVKHMHRKCILPICGLSFLVLNSVFWRAKVFKFAKSNLSPCYLMDCAYGIVF
jgi:hypothetical protein